MERGNRADGMRLYRMGIEDEKMVLEGKRVGKRG